MIHIECSKSWSPRDASCVLVGGVDFQGAAFKPTRAALHIAHQMHVLYFVMISWLQAKQFCIPAPC
jgi:hypothetical protein